MFVRLVLAIFIAFMLGTVVAWAEVNVAQADIDPGMAQALEAYHLGDSPAEIADLDTFAGPLPMEGPYVAQEWSVYKKLLTPFDPVPWPVSNTICELTFSPEGLAEVRVDWLDLNAELTQAQAQVYYYRDLLMQAVGVDDGMGDAGLTVVKYDFPTATWRGDLILTTPSGDAIKMLWSGRCLSFIISSADYEAIKAAQEKETGKRQQSRWDLRTQN